MIIPPSITLDPNPHPALRYAGLRSEALETLGRLCGEQWSDFNSHDPGITILEQLCFALTELAYRAQWPIADRLAGSGSSWQPGPAAILAGDPVTHDDLIAWLGAVGVSSPLVQPLQQPVLPLYFRRHEVGGSGDLELVPSDIALSQTSVVPMGVVQVSIDMSSDIKAIASALHGVRLLGRDFELRQLQPSLVSVKATLEVEPFDPLDGLMTAIHACLDGGIRTAAGAGLRHGLRSSDLIQALRNLPQVSQVVALELALLPPNHDANQPGDLSYYPWHLTLPEGAARLDPHSPITLQHRGLPLQPPARDSAAASQTPDPKSDALAALPAFASPRAITLAASTPRHQAPPSSSIAQHLPAVYGVGPAGLPAAATDVRRAQADALNTYLGFFDQLLDDAQAKLTLAPWLLAPLAASGATGLQPEQHATFLAHLLSRYGEQVGLYQQLGLYQQMPGAAQASAANPAASLVADRSAFLRNIAALSGGRGTGPNQWLPDPQPDPSKDSATTSEAAQGPFAERLRRKLGLPLDAYGTPPLLVIEHLLLRPLAEDVNQQSADDEPPIPFLADVVRPDPWSHRVSVVILNETLAQEKQPPPPEQVFERFVARTVRDELPAHLAGELHWFSGADWTDLLEVWGRFRLALHAYRQATLGGSTPPDPLVPLRLRDSRDRLISLLGLGQPWPLRDLPRQTDLQIVGQGQKAQITLRYSQPGVLYQLIKAEFNESNDIPVGAPQQGYGGEITLETPEITVDLKLRIRANLLQPGSQTEPQQASDGHPCTTLLSGEIRVVAGIDRRLQLSLESQTDGDWVVLPALAPASQARIANHDQPIWVKVAKSQTGVIYELIDNANRAQPFIAQALSQPQEGNGEDLWLIYKLNAKEDLDLAVRASIMPSETGTNFTSQAVLNTILPLRVRANPMVPLQIAAPVTARGGSTTVQIGDDTLGSQASVSYQLFTRPIGDDDWLLNPLALPTDALAVSNGQSSVHVRYPVTNKVADLDRFKSNSVSGIGAGAISISLAEPVVNDLLVVAKAVKTHRLSPLGAAEAGILTSEVLLSRAVVVLVQADAERQLTLQQQTQLGVWSLQDGEPGVAYTVSASSNGTIKALAAPLVVPLRQDAENLARGIDRLRVGIDLVVDGVDGALPCALFNPQPMDAMNLVVTARRMLSGVETKMTSALKLQPLMPPLMPPQTSPQTPPPQPAG